MSELRRVNKYKWDRAKVEGVIYNKKHPLRKKLALRSFLGKLWQGKREIIPREDVPKILKLLLSDKSGMPYGFQSGYAYLSKRYLGISRKRFEDFMKNTEAWQLLRRRRFNKDKKHDVTMGLLRRFGEAHNRIEYDLADLGKYTKSFKPAFRNGFRYLFVVCDKLTGFTWCRPLKKKDSKTCLAAWKIMLKDIKKKVGKPDSLASDRGKEFVLVNKSIPGVSHHNLMLSPLVEGTNGRLMRILVMLEGGMKSKGTLDVLLPKGLWKLNNVKSTRTGYTPAEAIKLDKDLIWKNRKKTSRATDALPAYRTKLKKGDWVRIDTSNPKETTFYKSFVGLKKLPQGLGETKYKAHWSEIFAIDHVKRYGQSNKFKVNGKYYFEHSLQKVPGRTPMVFRSETSKPVKKPVKKPAKKPVKKKKKPAPPPRARSTRVRKKIQRYGYP